MEFGPPNQAGVGIARYVCVLEGIMMKPSDHKRIMETVGSLLVYGSLPSNNATLTDGLIRNHLTDVRGVKVVVRCGTSRLIDSNLVMPRWIRKCRAYKLSVNVALLVIQSQLELDLHSNNGTGE